jgi:membrane protein
LGPAGSDFIEAILERSSDPSTGTVATIFGVLMVLMSWDNGSQKVFRDFSIS